MTQTYRTLYLNQFEAPSQPLNFRRPGPLRIRPRKSLGCTVTEESSGAF